MAHAWAGTARRWQWRCRPAAAPPAKRAPARPTAAASCAATRRRPACCTASSCPSVASPARAAASAPTAAAASAPRCRAASASARPCPVARSRTRFCMGGKDCCGGRCIAGTDGVSRCAALVGCRPAKRALRGRCELLFRHLHGRRAEGAGRCAPGAHHCGQVGERCMKEMDRCDGGPGSCRADLHTGTLRCLGAVPATCGRRRSGVRGVRAVLRPVLPRRRNRRAHLSRHLRAAGRRLRRRRRHACSGLCAGPTGATACVTLDSTMPASKARAVPPPARRAIGARPIAASGTSCTSLAAAVRLRGGREP